MVYYKDPYTPGQYNPLYTLNNQGPFFHCSSLHSFQVFGHMGAEGRVNVTQDETKPHFRSNWHHCWALSRVDMSWS